MDTIHTKKNVAIRKTTIVILVVLLLVGIIFLLGSIILKDYSAFWEEFTKSLGIAFLSVWIVSLIYELFVTEKHFHKFSIVLRKQIERGETNAAMCERLGILRIFQSRRQLEDEYDLKNIASACIKDSPFLIIAKTLTHTMLHYDKIKTAIEKGANVQLCCFDPKQDSPVLRKTSKIELSEITTALDRFRKNIAKWLETGEPKPTGSVELRCHNIDLMDSYFKFRFKEQPLTVWELSFGSDSDSKRVFLLNSEKVLGSDLNNRYTWIWREAKATTKFKYEKGSVSINTLSPAN